MMRSPNQRKLTQHKGSTNTHTHIHIRTQKKCNEKKKGKKEIKQDFCSNNVNKIEKI